MTKPTPDQLQQFFDAVEYLRDDEGDSVLFICDNPDFDGRPNSAVECCGNWTVWYEKRFTGATVLEALAKAVEAKKAFEAQGDCA